MSPDSLIDGVPETRLALADRGLQYGDGVFETLAVRAGRPEFWEPHLSRLAAGCERLGLPLPGAGLLRQEADRLCAARDRAVLKIVLTRGCGGRGYRPPQPCTPTRALSCHPWPADAVPLAPVAVRWCAHPLSENPRLAGLKHLNRLDQVLARAEWDDPDLQEGLMCLPDGTPVEATAANLFLVRDGRLHTPRLDRAGIAGIVRGVLIGRARQLGLEVLEARVDRDELLAADELFLCNSVYGLRPVRALGERRWPAPGPLTQHLGEDFETLRRAEAA